MQSYSYEISISKISTQIWIIILVPFILVALPILLMFSFVFMVWINSLFIFILIAVLLTIKLIKNSTRKGILKLNEKGLQFLFNNKSIFYNKLNNQAIAWNEIDKLTYHFDVKNNKPFIVFKFKYLKGAFVCIQDNIKGLNENTWPLYQSLNNFKLK